MIERLKIPRWLDGEVWFYHAGRRIGPPHRHPELELNLVLAGTASYVLANRRYDLVAGSVVWLFPRQVHVIAKQSPDLKMWIGVFRQGMLARYSDGPGTTPLRARNPAESHCRLLRVTEATTLEQLFRMVRNSRERSQTFNAGLGFLLLAARDAYVQAKDRPAGASVHPGVTRTAGSVLLNDPNTTVDDLAAAAGLSPGRLSRLFHQQMGMRLTDYRNRSRLRVFAELRRRDNRLTLLASALRAGFGSYAQFYRVHKREFGRPPGEDHKL